MGSVLNEMENEGLVVLGRTVSNEYDAPAPIEAIAEFVDAWAAKLSLPLGLVYCGTTINWPDDVEFTPIIIGLITFSGYGDDDEPTAGQVTPEAMDLARAQAIPAEFWQALKKEHGVDVSKTDEVLLAAAGWTWVELVDAAGSRVCSVSTEDAGYCAIPKKLREETWSARVGYC